MIFRTLTLVAVLWFAVTPSQASIFCPQNKNMVCSDDIYDFDRLGRPILLGNSLGKQARFIDNDQRNSCNVGYIYRKWFVDDNNDGFWQSTELECTQTLYFAYEDYPVSIQFPPNKIYSCKEDIKVDKPTWVTGPCNVIGLSYKDDVFEVSDDACYKILRHFKLIDWCDADGDGIMNIWEHTQVIKVIDEDAPQLQGCAYEEFGVDSDCKATVILHNKGFDDTACGAQQLTWIVQVDLWGNGDTDLEFSYAKSGDFYLKPTKNNEEVVVELPEKIGIGNHKVHWSLRDACGNIRSCHTTFRTLDKKPPTPYVHTFLTASFDATSMPLMVPARIFNVNSFDNCSPKKYLTYSFSPDVTDTIRIVDCNNAGFQFYTLYITDQAGNQEFIDVYLLAFDNGSCNGQSTLMASLSEGNGALLEGGRITATRPGMENEAVHGEGAEFTFEQMELYSDYKIRVSGQNPDQFEERINVADLVWLQEYIFGKKSLQDFQWVAADMNRDGRISVKDVAELKKQILNGFPDKSFDGRYRVVFEPGVIDESTLSSLLSQGESMKYDGSFDFKAVLTGDITTANTFNTENRNQALVEIQQTAEGVVWVATQDVQIKGFQWEIKSLSPQAELAMFGEASISWQIRSDDKGSFRVLATENIHWSAGDVIAEMKGVDAGNVVLTPESGWLTDEDQFERMITKVRVENNKGTVLFPNPVDSDEFFITDDVQIAKIVNPEGKSFRFVQNGKQIRFAEIIPAGVYFVQWQNEAGDIHSAKLYRL